MLKAIASLQKNRPSRKNFGACSFLPLGTLWAAVRALSDLPFSTTLQ